jgi:hypothetical protein
MERIALGYLRMSAAEFDASTPREVQWRYEAEQGREDREFDRVAQLACWLINHDPWIDHKRPLKSHHLLRRGGGKRNENWWET